jgi:hypothetical protein
VASSLWFWMAWFVPVCLLFVVYLLAKSVWNRSSSTELKVERATAPLVPSVSVLAIAIPLVANLTVQVAKPPAVGWTVGLLLAALTLALIALITGAYLLYKILLESPTETISISDKKWIPPVMSVQFAGMTLFLILSFAGLVGALLVQPAPTRLVGPSSSRFAIAKELPKLDTKEAAILEAWGREDERGQRWIAYRGETSTVIFCLKEGVLEKVIETKKKEEANALATGC